MRGRGIIKVKNYLFLLVFVGGIASAGCSDRVVVKKSEREGFIGKETVAVVETSERLTEEAIIVETIFLQAHRQEKICRSTIFDRRIVYSSIPIENLIPDVWILVLKCEHGNIIIIRNDDNNLDDPSSLTALLQKLEKGQKVTITYRSVYKNNYGDYRLERIRLIDCKYLDVKLK